MQATQLKRVALELGGNAPLVVLDDANLEHAVRSAVVGRSATPSRDGAAGEARVDHGPPPTVMEAIRKRSYGA